MKTKIKLSKRVRSSPANPVYASQVGVATYSGIAISDEALFSTELEALEQEQEEELKNELREYEAMARAERLYQ